LATRFVLFNQAAAIRREVFERIGGFPEDLKYLEDYDLPLRLSLEGPWAFIRDPLVMYGESSPVSFSAQARKDSILLAECEMQVYDRILARIEGNNKSASARRTLKWRLGMTRRRLAALNVQDRDRPSAKVRAGLLLAIDRYCLAFFRRSPWFPQPITKSIDPMHLRHNTSAAPRSMPATHSSNEDDQIEDKSSFPTTESGIGRGL
jgi:hypothetical protein